MRNSKNIITLCLIILMLSFTNIILCFSNNFVSALSYQNEVGIGFTFNPTLSVSLSSSDLIISNLTPGSSNDSNSINVSVSTNASYGYTLSANVGDSIHSNSNLVHSNNTDIFSSIATDANLENLTTDNTWGYSTSPDNGTTWSNYNGLSSNTNSTLMDTSHQTEDTIGFKIGAKVSNTQASGIYANTINFIAVTKVAPMSLLDSFIASGAEQYNGYYKMQDMTHDICESVDIEESELQLIDIRDNKIYWIAKLKDGNCWMTQNLDLAGGTTLTPDTTDFDSAYTIPETQGWQTNGALPTSSTSGFSNDNYAYVYNTGNSTDNCAKPGCYSYYSWDAATLGSGRTISTDDTDAPYSICPKEWKIPTSRNTVAGNSDFYQLAVAYGMNPQRTEEDAALFYNNAGPGTSANFLLGGDYVGTGFRAGGSWGNYWSATSMTSTKARHLTFSSSVIRSRMGVERRNGLSVRCLAR